jgi:hypothetical protein
VFILAGSSYRLHGGYGPDEMLRSPLFPKLKLSLAGVFDLPGALAAKGNKVKETASPYDAPPPGTRPRGPARYRRP